MNDNSQNSNITTDELVTMFAQLSEKNRQIVREFIYSIDSSSEHEQPRDLQILEN